MLRSAAIVRRLVVVLATVSLVGAAVATVFLFRAARTGHALHAYLAAHFVPRPDCPVPDPFVETNVVFDCYDGRLPSGRQVSLILGHEPGSRATVWNYLGLFVADAPPPAALAWRVRARGDWWGRRAGGAAETHVFIPPPEREPVRADAVAGGCFVAWRYQTLPSVDKLSAALAEVDAALR